MECEIKTDIESERGKVCVYVYVYLCLWDIHSKHEIKARRVLVCPIFSTNYCFTEGLCKIKQKVNEIKYLVLLEGLNIYNEKCSTFTSICFAWNFSLSNPNYDISPGFLRGLVAKPKMQILAKKIEPVANLMKVFSLFSNFRCLVWVFVTLRKKIINNKMT